MQLAVCLALCFLAFSLLASSTLAATPFSATFKLSGSIQNFGHVTGTINYDWDKSAFKLTFGGSDGYVELYSYSPTRGADGVYNKQRLYQTATSQVCGGKCQVAALQGMMPPFETVPTDWRAGTPIQVNGVACNQMVSPVDPTKANRNQVLAIGRTAANEPCSMTFGDGRVFTFTAYQAGTAGSFTPPTECACRKRIDFFMSLDGSGSISAAEWDQINEFVRKVIDQFTYGPEQAAMAITEFWGDAKALIGVTDDVNKLKTLTSTTLPRFGGGTNFIAGFHNIETVQFLGRRAGAIPVILTMTDGYGSQPLPAVVAKINHLMAPPHSVNNWVSVYVGNDLNLVREQMVILAGNKSSNVFSFSNYQLAIDAIGDIIAAACDADVKDNPCGAGCCGFCMCSQCASPTSCDDGLKCTTEALVATGTPGLSCCSAPQPVPCVPADKCKESTCDPADGVCKETTKNCDFGDTCKVYSCDPATGCKAADKCPQGPNMCITPTCTAGVCGTAPVICPANESCTTFSCDVADGKCKPTPVNCDDNNACTQDSCAAPNGCNHTLITPCNCNCQPGDICNKVDCNQVTGQCVTTSKCAGLTDICYTFTGNCDLTNGCEKIGKCDDNDPCTVDSCDPVTGACAHAAKNCDDGNACTDDTCDATGTCRNPPKDCTNGNKCLTATCNDQTGCDIKPLNLATCDDFNACTNDTCVPSLGCTNVNITCDDAQPCTVDSCEAVRGCVSNTMICPDRPKCDIGQCVNGTCDFIRPELCTDEIVGITLGVGAIIGIIIAVIVVAALLAAAAYKGVQAYNARKDLDQSGHSNPLYEQGGQYGENKLFGDYQAFK